MEKWATFVFKHNFFKHKAVGIPVRNSIVPTVINLPKKRAETNNPIFKLFITAAMKHGIRGVAIFSLYSAQGENAVLLIYHDEIESFLKNDPSLQPTLSQIALFYHFTISKCLHKLASNRINLNDREKECLLWVAKNKTVEEIADEIHRTLRTVNFHLHNANQKLEVKNKYQAGAKALSLGLIKL